MEYAVIYHCAETGWHLEFVSLENTHLEAARLRTVFNVVRIIEVKTVASWGPDDPGIAALPPKSEDSDRNSDNPKDPKDPGDWDYYAA